MNDANRFCFVFVTTGSKENAEKIATHLVSDRRAACVNLFPGITSVYRWKGEVQLDEEYLLLIKTRKSLLNDLEKMITELHTYEVPEIVSFPMTQSSAPYLNWLQENTKPNQEGNET